MKASATAACSGMGVVAGHRRRGIGSGLLTATIGAARRRGMTPIELEVFADNAAAIALYERHGFEREGLKRRARLLDCVYEDAIMMANLVDDE